MRLTDFGKRVIMTASVILLAAIFVLGAIVCLFDLAYAFRINQQAYNVLFIMCVMPICLIGGKELLSRLF